MLVIRRRCLPALDRSAEAGHRVATPDTANLLLDQILATASPFDDVFDCGDASSWNGTDETARDSDAPQV